MSAKEINGGQQQHAPTQKQSKITDPTSKVQM
jgi:hypothetical protein